MTFEPFRTNWTEYDLPDRAAMARVAGECKINTRDIAGANGSRHMAMEIGTLHVEPFEDATRDLGEGPSWAERYSLPMALSVPVLYVPTYPCAVTVTFPVISTYREGGAKWGGVSVAVRNDTEHRASTHTMSAYQYQLGQLARDGWRGWTLRLHRAVTTVSTPYDHEPTRSRDVIHFTAQRY